MKAYDEAKNDPAIKNPCLAVQHMKGYYRCCMYKWCKQRKAEQWSLLCAAAPRVAKSKKDSSKKNNLLSEQRFFCMV